MEHNSSNVVISMSTLNKNQEGHDHNSYYPKKKKRNPMHVFKVALYMIKSKKSKQSNSASLETVSVWKKFFGLGSVRPLHMQSDPKGPQRPMEGATIRPASVITSPVVEHLEVFTPPMSPAQASVASSSCCGMSQYASATNLQELDEGEEDDQKHGIDGDKDGDEMIDVKAEQFIAQFYQQMRLQNEAYANRRNRRLNDGQ